MVTIIAGLIATGRSLDISVVAEGVETGEQIEFPRQRECEQVQGLLFSRPSGRDELELRDLDLDEQSAGQSSVFALAAAVCDVHR